MVSSVALDIPILLAVQATSPDSLNPMLLIVPIVLVLIALAAAGWYFMRQRSLSSPVVPPDGDKTEPLRPANAKKSNWSGGKTTSAGMIAMLEILEGPDGKVDGMSAGRKIEIYSGRVRIGRSTELCDLQIYDIDDNSTVSRRHCTIEFDRTLNGFVIIDEGSRSGTRVGTTMIEAHQRVPLKDGDVIELGFVEQSGARLRFTSPIGKASRSHTAPPAIETASVEIRAAHGAVIPYDEPLEGEPTPLPGEIQGIETEVRHQHAPVSSLVKPGTGPLSQPQEPCDIFLSYSRKDRETMLRIRTDLRISNISVWTDENLTPGTPLWRQAIENAIESAGCIVIILSPDAKQSPWVQREIDYASTQNKPIIPLLVRGDERTAIPLTLISAQWADLRENYDVQFNGVLNIIKQTIEDSKTSSQ
jgi:pSer/pThr/pTyr-binding forkhead associated (FHA) protein